MAACRMSGKSYIEITKVRNGWQIESSYEADFVEWIKQIPHWKRDYDAATNRWYVFDAVDFGRLVAACTRWFDLCTVIERTEDGALRYRNLRTDKVEEQPRLHF
jgi:hypothetical protein